MESIALKIKELNYDEKVLPQVSKFLAPLTMVSLEEEKKILAFLSEKGIIISRPSEQKILACGYEFIKMQVNQMEALGHLKAYQDDPSRIASRGAIIRLLYLIKKNVPFINEEGIYLSSIFNKKEYEKEFGISYLRKEESEEVNSFSEPVKEDVTKNISVSNNADTNIIEQILSMPQSISLNDDTYERYERLYDLVPKILNVEEIPDSITENLIKLVTNEISDDRMILYYAITFGKNISPEEDQRIKNAIELEMQTTTILDIDLRRVA